MGINKEPLVFFILDRLPNGVIPLKINELTFISNDEENGDSGFVYDKNHEIVYTLDNTRRQVTNLWLKDLEHKAEISNTPLLKVKVANSSLKQATLKIYESLNPELQGKVGVEVDLKENYSYSDIPWLPAFCIDEAYTEFKALDVLFQDLLVAHKEKLEKEEEEEREEKRKQEERRQHLQQVYLMAGYGELEQEEPSNSEDTVYTVETLGEQTLKATTNKETAILYSEENLIAYGTLNIKTWIDGEHVKTISLSEG